MGKYVVTCTETYIIQYIMMTITLYECDLCYLVQDFYSLSKLLGGGLRFVAITAC
jgi:hypothetical protein